MAMFDDPGFLVNHLRNAFITSDETGMCELVMDNGDCPNTRPVSAFDNSSRFDMQEGSSVESSDELSHSCDIVFDMEVTGHRRRSDTAQRLEKLKRDKQKQSQIKHIQWQTVHHSVNEYDEYFDKKELFCNTQKPSSDTNCKKSMLSFQMEQFDSAVANPFLEFAKFDGHASGGLPTKKIDIYLTMAPPNERSFPMTVVTLSSAKVNQLIGLICWQYTKENREPPLTNTNIESYTLNMAEDDGEVDTDFPPLDSREPISKFGFSKLALVVKPVTSTTTNPILTEVVVHTADGGRCVYSVDADATTLREIHCRVLDQRQNVTKPGVSYRMEKLNVPGVAVDLDAMLSAVNATEFCLIRENSVWPGRTDGSQAEERGTVDIMCHQYKSYSVSVVHKLRSATPAQLGVSVDKIELDPTSTNGVDKNAATTTTSYFSRRSVLFSKQKSLTLPIDSVAACFIHQDHTNTVVQE